MEFKHKSVLLEETIRNLKVKPDGIYVDGTLGGGGHAYEVCRQLSAKGSLIGIDQDEAAIEAAGERLQEFGDRVTIIRSNYCNMKKELQKIGITSVDGITLDLGVSSFQLDNAERGFTSVSYTHLIFRKEKIKPLVGDNVEIEVLSEEEKLGNVVDILPRKNELIRPAVANVDQALVIFAAREPKPNFSLLDRFLVIMERQEIPVVICFNKQDLADSGEADRMLEIYTSCGYRVLMTSAARKEGLDELKDCLLYTSRCV